jgi:hypothetical protein
MDPAERIQSDPRDPRWGGLEWSEWCISDDLRDLVGVGGSGAVAFVVRGCCLGELVCDGLGRAVVGGSVAGGPVG